MTHSYRTLDGRTIEAPASLAPAYDQIVASVLGDSDKGAWRINVPEHEVSALHDAGIVRRRNRSIVVLAIRLAD